MRFRVLSFTVLLFSFVSATQTPVQAQGFIPRKQTQPPGPPLSPEQAIQKMSVPEGFHVELVASEPDILNPVAMAFDDRGRIYVTESFEYPRHEPGPGRDRIKILEDTDGDGRVDSVKIFAEGLNIPSGIAVGHGGVWVANAPDILFLQDTDNDDRADKSTVVVTGFGRDDTHELPNALTWGPDGYLYGLNGVFNRSVVKQDDRTYDFTCAMFRIDPRTMRFDLFCEGTSNPWGIAFDAEGSAFISACVIDHLWHLTESAYYLRQGGPYPPHTFWANSIVKHKHQMAAYCGIEYFDSEAYPAAYRDKLYMGNIHGGCLNVDRIQRSGATYEGFGEPDFITANDVWFMPVAQKVGPDGCLYVLDWYDRYHCYQDASADPAGVDRGHGRLYRIVHDKRPAKSFPDISKLSNQELVQALAHPNIFVRQRAQLELCERKASLNDPESAKRLAQVSLDENATLKARMHSLWTLVGSGPLGLDMLGKLFASPSPEVRAWGVRIAGNQHEANETAVNQIKQLAHDPDPRVRLQVAIAASKISHGNTSNNAIARLLIDVARHSENDPIMPNVIWQNMLRVLPDQSELALEEILRGVDLKRDLLRDLSTRFASRLAADIKPNPQDPTSQKAMKSILQLSAGLSTKHPNLAAESLRSVVNRIRSGEVQLAPIQSSLSNWYDSLPNKPGIDSPKSTWDQTLLAVRVLIADSKALALSQQLIDDRKYDPVLRRELLQTRIQQDPRSAANSLKQVLEDLSQSQPVEKSLRDLILDLGIANADANDIQLVMQSIPALTTELQASIAERMCQRETTAVPLLEQIASNQLRKELLSPNRVRILAASKNEAIQKSVAKIWGTVSAESSKEREAVIRKVADQLRWDARGKAERGWAVYDRICGQCHVMHGRGNEVGPNITANGRGSYDQLLVSVFNPSLVIGDAYKSVTVRTDEGSVITGLLLDRNDQRTVVKIQGGKEVTIPASEIEEFKHDTKSLMPEGIETQLSPQELADLFALLTLERPPESKENVKISGTPEYLHNEK